MPLFVNNVYFQPEASPEEEESSSEESSDEEITPGACVVCDGEEDTVICHMCADSFHLDCHEPPLRYQLNQTQRDSEMGL